MRGHGYGQKKNSEFHLAWMMEYCTRSPIG
jgi:hypothetical protein